MTFARTLAAALPWLAALAGCSFDGGPPDEPIYQVVRGVAVDFVGGERLEPTTIEVLGVAGADVEINGAEFEIRGVLSFSVVHLAISADGYRPTIGAAIEVADASIEGLRQEVVSEAYAADLADGFAVASPSSLVLVQALEDGGLPREGLSADPFAAIPAPQGAFFLDEQLRPEIGRDETVGDAWLAFFDVPEGLIQFAVVASPFVVRAASAPVHTGSVTIARAVVVEGELETPTDVSFADDIIPIFTRRGCLQCHGKKGDGLELGRFKLDKVKDIYSELTLEPSQSAGLPRVDLVSPEKSLVLTKPSLEDPPDGHPNSTFASPTDPDYLLLLGWISEGAADN